MAWHGKVLNLFNERYLKLQDVTENVEPLPVLVPYEDYAQNILVYKITTEHDLFMGQIQDFTEQLAREIEKELWSWIVQWEVEEGGEAPRSASVPAFKKPRIAADSPLAVATSPVAEVPPLYPDEAQTPAYMTVERRTFDHELLQEDLVLRVLLDIVHGSPALVPNFIEALYQAIDFYERDGYALKCGLQGEIPSLWHFEAHPIELPGIKGKLDLKAIERYNQVSERQESERSKYKEKLFGPKLPNLHDPITTRTNIPKDPEKLNRYVVACYKSRRQALQLLLEAGMTWGQVDNYAVGQETKMKDTPVSKNGDATGLKHFLNEQGLAHQISAAKEEQKRFKETLRNSQLSSEEQQGAAEATIILPTRLIPVAALPPRHEYGIPSYRDVIEPTNLPHVDPICTHPAPLHGKLKSKLFAWSSPADVGGNPMEWGETEPDSDLEGPDNPSDSDSDGGDDGDGGNIDEVDGEDVDMDAAPSASAAPPTAQADDRPSDEHIAQFLANLNGDQMQSLIPRLGQAAQQQLAGALAHATAPVPAPQVPSWVDGQNAPLQGTLNPGLMPQLPALSTLTTGLANGGPTGQGSTSQLPMTATNNQATWVPTVPNLTLPPNSQQQPRTQGSTSTATVQPFASNQAQASSSITLSSQPSGSNQTPHNQPGVSAPTNHFSLTPGINSLSFTNTQHGNPSNPPPAPATTTMTAPPQPPGPSGPTLSIPPPSGPEISPPRPGIQRNHPPSPIKPVSHSAISNITSLSQAIPVLIYYPQVLNERNVVGTDSNEKTDAVMLGYLHQTDSESGAGPGTKITLTRAIFLPAQLHHNLMHQVRKGGYTVLETYPSSHANIGKLKAKAASHDGQDGSRAPNQVAYEKLWQAFRLMSECDDKEEELTKRWRAGIGSVWEGWGVTVDREIGLSAEERQGAIVNVGVEMGALSADHGSGSGSGDADVQMDDEARMMEMEELLDEDDEFENDMDSVEEEGKDADMET